MNEEVLDETLQKASSVVDAAAIALDVTELSVSDQWTNPNVVTEWILKHANQKHLDRVRDMCDYAGTGTFILGNVLNYASICSSLYGADQISADGAKRWMETYVDTKEYGADAEQNWKRVKKNIDKTEEKLGLQAFGTWLETYWMSNGVSFAKILTENFNGINGTLGVVGLASTIWSGGTSLLYGKYYDQTESMMAAYFGEQYEKEALAAVADVIVRYLNGSASEEETRAILYHSMAACYTTRYFGCQAMADNLAYYPKQEARQQEINQLLVKLMAIVQNDSIPMGMRAEDVANLIYHEEIHYPNVTFKLCQVQGTITYCDSGKPAEKLEVWISDETGEKLAEFITDESGAFDVSFEIDVVNVLDSGERMKQITFHVEEWWYPEILETVEIPIFKKSRIDGLWAGEQKETIQCYLEDVKEENGQLILDIRKIEINEEDKIFNLEIPTFLTDSSYDSYFLQEGQYEIADSIERVVLKDGMEIKTMYALLYPDGTFVGEMFQLFSSSVLNSADVDMDVLLNSDMKTAEEIYQYVELYRTLNGSYPAYEMGKVNSEVQSLEPILIELY